MGRKRDERRESGEGRKERKRVRERECVVTAQQSQLDHLLISFDIVDLPPVLLATERATSTVKVLKGGNMPVGMTMSTSRVFLNEGCEMTWKE